MKNLKKARKEYKRHQAVKTMTKLSIERELLLSTVIY